MRYDTTRHVTSKRTSMLTGSLIAGLGVVAVPAIGWAGSGADASGQSWVIATIVAVLLVSGLWLAAITSLRAAVRLRWIRRKRLSGLQRTMHVLFGGLLLMALVLPYLTVAFPVAAMLTAGVFLLATAGSFLLRKAPGGEQLEGGASE